MSHQKEQKKKQQGTRLSPLHDPNQNKYRNLQLTPPNSSRQISDLLPARTHAASEVVANKTRVSRMPAHGAVVHAVWWWACHIENSSDLNLHAKLNSVFDSIEFCFSHSFPIRYSRMGVERNALIGGFWIGYIDGFICVWLRTVFVDFKARADAW